MAKKRGAIRKLTTKSRGGKSKGLAKRAARTSLRGKDDLPTDKSERKGSETSVQSDKSSSEMDRDKNKGVDKRKEKGKLKGRETRMTPFGTRLGLFNRDIFKDPFFTEGWGDLFDIGSVDRMFDRARDMGKKAIKAANRMTKDVDTSYPGNYTSKSFYRTYSSGPGQEPKREVISQETITNVDDKGRKYTELWKNLEGEKEKKTTHTKLIDDKGVKEMRTHKLDTGEEYEHIDYRHMNENELNNFNNEFEKGVRNVRQILPSRTSFPSLLSDLSRFPSRSMLFDPFRTDRDLFPSHHHDRFGLPSSDWGWANDFGGAKRLPELDYGTSRPQSAATDVSEKRRR
jgi:hypothetical protein